jgi:hypothetical protein
MKPVKEVTCCVVDNGLFAELAARVAREFAHVYYCIPGALGEEFPRVERAYIGKGMPGVEVVGSFWPLLDKIDLFCFFDVNHGPLQDYLVSIGKAVWGARMGEELELDRERMKRLQEKLGLPVNPWRAVEGVDALEKWLQDHRNQYVKLSRYRGLSETFKAKNSKLIQEKLDQVRADLGPEAQDMRFVVEDPITDAVEVGTDGWMVDGRDPVRCLMGIEVKDRSYAGCVAQSAKLPKALLTFNQVMAPIFKGFGYRGFRSTEHRITKDGTSYMNDLCCRGAIPPSGLYMEMVQNLPEVIWQGANGVLVEPRWAAVWGVECIIESAWCDTHWQPVEIPEQVRRFVKLRHPRLKGKQWYNAPQKNDNPYAGEVIGWGRTLDAAIDMCRDVAEAVDGYDLKINVDALGEAAEQIAKAADYGVEMKPS